MPDQGSWNASEEGCTRSGVEVGASAHLKGLEILSSTEIASPKGPLQMALRLVMKSILSAHYWFPISLKLFVFEKLIFSNTSFLFRRASLFSPWLFFPLLLC